MFCLDKIGEEEFVATITMSASFTTSSSWLYEADFI